VRPLLKALRALRAAALAAACGAAAGCGGGSAGSPGTLDDPDPVFTDADRAALAALSPASLPPPPPDPTNRFADDADAAALGRTLFSDPLLSGPLLDADDDGSPGSLGRRGETGKVACAGCHVPEGGFSDTRSFQLQISLGAGWGRRRAPSLLDVGQAKLLMWDGRRDALYNQPFGPIESVVEMNSSRLYAAEQVFRKYQHAYEALFGPMPPLDDAAQFPPLAANLTGCQPKNPSDPQPTCDGTFHGMPGDGAEFDGLSAENQRAVTTVVVNVGKALGAYERRLTCGPGAFDRWVHGESGAMSRAAQRGAALFVGKGRCVGCHAGPFLSDQQFHNLGVRPDVVQQGFLDADDHGAATGIAAAIADPLNTLGTFSDGSDGRLPTSVTAAMEGAFRTPTLRCVSRRPTFMHTGQYRSLAAVIAFLSRGGSPSGYPGTNELHPLDLSSQEQDDLSAFLMALDGDAGDGGS
jgi:cytochrome c peroxidase